MSHPTVSVIVAAYNYGRYLAACLDSLCAQTFVDWEAVIVDDGSTDDTPQVVARYLPDERIRYLCTDHVGQPAAKNHGIRAASGRYVAFLDADDVWLPEKLEKQVRLLDEKPEVGVVATRRMQIDPQGNVVPLDADYVQHRGYVVEHMFWRNFVCFSSSMVRASVFERVGVFDEALPLAIDYDLWLRAARCFAFDYVDEPLVYYRSGHANLSKRQTERLQCVRRIMRRFLDENGGRRIVRRRTIRMAWAEHWMDTAADHAFHGQRWAALAACCRSLAHRPWHYPAWRGVLTCWWPQSVRRGVLRMLRRPDWRQSAAAESSNSFAAASLDSGARSTYSCS